MFLRKVTKRSKMTILQIFGKTFLFSTYKNVPKVAFFPLFFFLITNATYIRQDLKNEISQIDDMIFHASFERKAAD